MKILHVIPSVSPARGGPSRVVRMMTTAQAEAGHAVTVATTDDDGPGRGAVQSEPGVDYRVFPRQCRFYTVSLPMAQWLAGNVARFDAVHIHSLFSFPSTAAALAALRRGASFVVRPLGTLNRWGMENRRPWFKRLSLAAVESGILRRAGAVQFTSEQELSEAAALGVAHRPVVIPNPIEIDPGEEVERDPGMVLFVGRIDRIKGLDLLIEAMRTVPGARLTVAGDGDESLSAALREQARKANVEVEWLGAVDGAQRRRLLSGAGVFVLPSYSENFGVAAGEAMAAGVPVVVSDQVALHTEVARVGAGLVTPCDAAALGEAIARLCGDAALARRCGEAGRRLVAERYSTAAVTAQLIELYREIGA